MERGLVLGLLLVASLPAQAPPGTVVVRVSAQANPYLAGMPGGARVSWGDSAPRQSPLQVPVSLEGATAVTFAATGAASHGPQPCPPYCSPPEGRELTDHQYGSEDGISDVRAPYESLLGVFLDDQPPDRSKAPHRLDFGRIGLKFTTLSPELKQLFFIGGGKTRDGTARRYLVPKGASRLFLGIMDGYQWNNNTGSFLVTVTVEGAAVSSKMFSTDSDIAYAKWACLPGRSHCTPEHEIVEPRGAGQYHVVLPAHLEWGASIPNPAGARVRVTAVAGTVCLDFGARGAESCNGAQGDGRRSGAGYLAPEEAAGALISKTTGDRTWFSVNDRSGDAFARHDGYFEFDVTVQ